MDQTDVEPWDHNAVNQMIARQDYDGAARRIDAFLAHDPGFLGARIARARLLLATGETAQARDEVTELRTQAPDNLWVWAIALQALTQHGDVADAVAQFREGQARLLPDDSALASALSALLPALDGWPAQVALLKDALAVQPDSRTLQLRLATRAPHVGDFALALDLLQRAEATGPLPSYAKSFQSRLYPMLSSMAESHARIAKDIDAGEETAESLCRLCRFAAAAGHFEQAQSALMRALERFPTEWRVLYRLNRVFLSPSQDAALFTRLSAQAQSGGVDQNWTLQFALFALRTGETAIARDLLTALRDDPRVSVLAQPVLEALDALGDTPPRPAVLEDADLCVVKAANPRGTVFMFGSFLGGLNYLPHRCLDALFADLAVNVVYLRDPYGRSYLSGLPEIAGGEAGLHNALARLATELGGGRIITMGSSAAGYAALRAGLAIGAHSVLSLAGMTGPQLGRSGDEVQANQAALELFRDVAEPLDLAPVLASKPQTHLTLIIGDSYAPDIERSRAVADVANAQIIALAGVNSHHSGMPAIASGILREQLERALEG